MGLSVAAGHNQFTGIYVPEIWSGRLLEKFYKATVFADIANTSYEGEISKQGDKVHIRDTPTVTINDHVKGQTLDYEHLIATDLEFDIDKAKSWSFLSDDIDEKQSDINYVEDWTKDAAEQMAIAIDSQILAGVYSSAHVSNQGATAGLESASFNLGVSGTPLQVTASNIINFILDCGTVLDEQNVPEDGRYIVLPPVICNLIKKSDLAEVQVSGDDSTMRRHGVLGMIDRFTIYRSNSIDTTADSGGETAFNIIAGQKTAITFASQLTKNESLKAPNQFGQLYRGLQVYGYKVIKPESLVWGYVYK